MCWNEQVSLNTFLFSSFVLMLIVYNNSYTQYKIKFINSNSNILFISSVIVMQLVEVFIWRNINNKFYNHIFSTMAAFVLFIQPITSLMMISNISLRNKMISIYSLIFMSYFIYEFSNKNMMSRISRNGHLTWLFFDSNILLYFCWLFFFLFSFVYEKFDKELIFGISLLLISYVNYYEDKTVSSMWCWVVNSMMIFYSGYLLLYLPFREINSI